MVLTILWIVAVINAVNLIDILDGLAAGVCTIIALVLLINSLINGTTNAAITSACLAGACIGFLRYNLPKARIFLGDTGSMFLGLTVAALAMSESYAEINALAVLSPLLILSFPLFELTFVTLVRFFKGASIFQGSPDHIAIRLRNRGWSDWKIILWAYGLSIVMGGLATVNRFLPRTPSILLLATSGVFFLVCGVLLARIGVKPVETKGDGRPDA
jgi:UDP-GlcNAc:undecaprenyl-phosphate GlcNAc-1-phosphate transferase